jgi:hypothetical protein
MGQAWWYTPVIPATWEVDMGGLRLKANPDKTARTLSEK